MKAAALISALEIFQDSVFCLKKSCTWSRIGPHQFLQWGTARPSGGLDCSTWSSNCLRNTTSCQKAGSGRWRQSYHGYISLGFQIGSAMQQIASSEDQWNYWSTQSDVFSSPYVGHFGVLDLGVALERQSPVGSQVGIQGWKVVVDPESLGQLPWQWCFAPVLLKHYRKVYVQDFGLDVTDYLCQICVFSQWRIIWDDCAVAVPWQQES